MKRSILAIVALLFSVGFLSAGGAKDQTPTKLEIGDQPRIYMAPANTDAKIRALALPFSSVTIPGNGKVVKSWTFTVYDSKGAVVFEQSRTQTADRGALGELFNVGDKPKVDIPADLTWDGTYNVANGSNNGQMVPDGDYTYQIAIVDDTNSRAQSAPLNITIKNAPVTINTVAVPEPKFSPGGEKKTVTIVQSGSQESFWQGVLTDATGNAVRTFTWQNTTDNVRGDVAPANFEWDGKADSGDFVPQGLYTYTLTGRNRAGAEKVKSAEAKISISWVSGDIGVDLSSPYFSPNADGILDVLALAPKLSVSDGLQNWILSVRDQGGANIQRWTKTGTAPVPDSVAFDGKDASGKLLPGGKYTITLSASYDNGGVLTSNPVAFEIDLTPPQLKLSMDHDIFGGQALPSSRLSLRGDDGVDWKLHILDAKSSELSSKDLGTGTQIDLDFDGTDANGASLPDGLYTLMVEGRDKAGNLVQQSVRTHKDTQKRDLSFDTTPAVLKSSTGQAVRFTPIASSTDNITSMRLSVVDANGKTTNNRQGNSFIQFLDWNGKDDTGSVLPDGVYSVTGEITWANGATARATASITLDSTVVHNVATISADRPTFIPSKGDYAFAVSASPQDGIANWSLSITTALGLEVSRQNGGSVLPSSLTWNGKNSNGQMVDGTYMAKLTVTWKDDQSATAQTASPIVLVASGPVVDLKLASDSFEPGSDLGDQTLTMNLSASAHASALSAWTIEIWNQKRELLKTLAGNGELPASQTWDGVPDGTATLESGDELTIDLKVSDELGFETTASANAWVGIKVTKLSESRFKIATDSIHFAGDSSDIFKSPEALLGQNIKVLQTLAKVLKLYPDYQISLEGYANDVWATYPSSRARAEYQQKIMIPLSHDRAAAVEMALVMLGVDQTRFVTKGFGGDDSIVPPTDSNANWQNRRVEFYLEK